MRGSWDLWAGEEEPTSSSKAYAILVGGIVMAKVPVLGLGCGIILLCFEKKLPHPDEACSSV